MTILFGDIPIRSLMDSGSQVTTITETCYKQHFQGQDNIDNIKWLELSAGNGLEIPIVGVMTINITIKDTVFEDIHVLVVKDPQSSTVHARKLVTPAVIGNNVVTPLYQQVNVETNFNLDSTDPDDLALQQALHIYQLHLIMTEQIEAEIKTKSTDILGFAKTKPHLIIPADTAISIECTTRQLPEGYITLVEPSNTALPLGLVIMPTISKVSHGKVKVEVQNHSSADIILQRPTGIATIHQCDVLNPQLNVVLQESQDSHLKATVTINELYNGENISNWQQLPFQINMDDVPMTRSENIKLLNIFKNYQNVFSQHDDDIGYTDLVEHRIDTVDSLPIKRPDRRVPPQLIKEVKSILQDWLKAGIIRESSSPYASQMVLVRKKTGEIRICIDYRGLNKVTIKDAYPLPRIEECIDSLKDAKYFCSLDLTQGYLQVKLSDEDSHKTAFRALGCLYEWTRLCFGLCNSPATFSRLMGRCFGDFYHNGLIVYLDDMLIYGSSISEVTERLELVFERLQLHGLKLKPRKCHFFKESVSFLGHTISNKGIKTDKEKIRAVEEFPKPNNEKTLRQFLGLCSYFRRFIHNFAHTAGPLHEIIKGKKKQKYKISDGRPWQEKWTSKCDQAFEELKVKLITAPLLGYPDFSEPFCLEVDASLEGFGAILSQQRNKMKHVIAYASRRLKPHERTIKDYSSMKLEFLALHWAITKKFRDYLYGSKFVVKTDNNPLSKILSSKQTAANMGKIADLADFTFDIEYRTGKTNQAADALSRNPVNEQIVMNQEQVVNLLSDKQILTTVSEELIIKIGHETDIKVFQQDSMCHVTDLPAYSQQDIQELQQNDPNISRVYKFLQKNVKPDIKEYCKDPPIVQKIMSKWNQLEIKNGIIYRNITLKEFSKLVILLPQSLVPVILHQLHDKLGHQGIERTTKLVRERCYWPTLANDVENYCKKCSRCIVAKEPTPKVKTPMNHLIATQPLEILAIDFTMLEKSSSGLENVLVMTDIFSKLTLAIPTRDQTAKTVARVLIKEWITKLGIPKRIHSDRGRSFENCIIQELCYVQYDKVQDYTILPTRKLSM